MININDIAHALSYIPRFNGHIKKFYSVAEHSVHVARLIKNSLWAEHDVRYGLLHDAPEAYIGDMATPLKMMLAKYRRIEKAIMSCICDKYHLMDEVPETVYWADKTIMMAEIRDLLVDGITPFWEDYMLQNKVDLPKNRIEYPWSPAKAKAEFLKMADELCLEEESYGQQQK